MRRSIYGREGWDLVPINQILHVSLVGPPGVSESPEHRLIRDRPEPGLVPHPLTEDVHLPPVRLRPLSGPVVVQVNEAESAASLRGQAEGVLEELSRGQVLEPLSAAAAFLGPEFLN